MGKRYDGGYVRGKITTLEGHPEKKSRGKNQKPRTGGEWWRQRESTRRGKTGSFLHDERYMIKGSRDTT